MLLTVLSVNVDVIILNQNTKMKRFEDEWIIIDWREDKPKTKVYYVLSKCSDCTLGLIQWYPQWRHYCFLPDTYIKLVFSDRCLLNISKFITELNKEHKKAIMEKKKCIKKK